MRKEEKEEEDEQPGPRFYDGYRISRTGALWLQRYDCGVRKSVHAATLTGPQCQR
jgi:hypothetical protein